jgi:very-short-patch-repair endonuclease
VLDFYCPEAKLAVEVDGNLHAEPKQVRSDRLRTWRLATEGIRVLRFPVGEVERSIETVLDAIWDAAGGSKD